MSDAAEVLQSAGLRPTRQRLAIVEVLGQRDRPATAQALHRSLRGGGKPGLATVYRTLRALEVSGLAQTFPSDGELAYKLCPTEHHHHLTCERCGTVQEIPSCEVEDWAEAVSRRRGFLLTSHHTELFGLCEGCRSPGSRPATER